MVYSIYSDMSQRLVSDREGDSEDEAISEKQHLPQFNSKQHKFGIILLVAICTLAATGVVALMAFVYSLASAGQHDSLDSGPGRHDTSKPHCGNTVEVARMRGCIYDIMLGGWTPPQCYSEKLETEFMTLPELKWYYDEAHTREIPLQVLKQGELEIVYPAHTYHDRHCLYTWRRLHEAVMEGGLVDYQTGSPEHSRHCTLLIMGVIPSQPIKSEETKFNYCVVPGSVYNGEIKGN